MNFEKMKLAQIRRFRNEIDRIREGIIQWIEQK